MLVSGISCCLFLLADGAAEVEFASVVAGLKGEGERSEGVGDATGIEISASVASAGSIIGPVMSRLEVVRFEVVL